MVPSEAFLTEEEEHHGPRAAPSAINDGMWKSLRLSPPWSMIERADSTMTTRLTDAILETMLERGAKWLGILVRTYRAPGCVAWSDKGKGVFLVSSTYRRRCYR